MQTRSKTWAFLLAALSLLLVPPAAALAQPDRPAAADDEAAKNAIFDSDQWRRMRMSVEDWLSVQNFYTDEQVRRFESEMGKQIATLNSRELATFMERMQGKMDLLLSSQAADLRAWMGHFVSPSVVLTPEEVKSFDVLNMTVPQLQEALQKLEARRTARRAAGSAFQGARQQKVSSTVEANRARQQTSQQIRSSAQSARTQRVTQQAHLAPPRRPPPPPRPRPQIILGGAGGVGFALPMP